VIDDSKILITGGTGSMGQHLVDFLLANYNPQKVVIYSRNEANQVDMAERLGFYKAKLRFILGSVTDYDRMYRAFKGIDYVIHAAALKVVPKAEYNPLEYLAVNVNGTKNVILACCERGIKRAIFLATDKGVMPVNLYGFTKGLAERIWLEANYLEPIFSIVRYGNIMGSRGSVINKFIEQRNRGEKDYELTQEDCTRYWVDVRDAIDIVLKAIEDKPGLIYCSKTKAFRIKDLIRAIYLRAELRILGLREGEKIHETLINEYEALRARDYGTYYKIFPAYSFDDEIVYDKEHGERLSGPVMTSDKHTLMTLKEVRAKVKQFVDKVW
jgi:FlaA1/EpsC-like NDP-sugar epimerase